jgi:CRP/FNR family transcriptional regulator, cyclic AMP receptor protein
MEDVAALKAFLRTVPICGGLEEGTLDRLVPMLRREEYQTGAVVLREGDQGLCMYVVRSGEVELYRRGRDRPAIRIARLGAGECVGEMAIIDVQPRSATLVAGQPTVLYSLRNKDLYTLYQQDLPGYVMLIQSVCRELSRRLRRADARLTELMEQAGAPADF